MAGSGALCVIFRVYHLLGFFMFMIGKRAWFGFNINMYGASSFSFAVHRVVADAGCRAGGSESILSQISGNHGGIKVTIICARVRQH